MTAAARTGAEPTRVAVGAWIGSSDFTLAEALAGEGLDWIAIDREHGVIAQEHLPMLAAACARYDVWSLVRVPFLADHEIAVALDHGCTGVIVPHVDTADQARAAVAATRYPPAGVRGWGPRRGSDYGRIEPADYAAGVLARPAEVWCQLESAASIEAAEEIAAVDGVTGLIVGPADLSADFGELGQTDSPRIWAAIERVAAAAARYGVPFGVPWGRPRPDQVERSVALGATIVAIGTQERLMRAGAREMLDALGAIRR